MAITDPKEVKKIRAAHRAWLDKHIKKLAKKYFQDTPFTYSIYSNSLYATIRISRSREWNPSDIYVHIRFDRDGAKIDASIQHTSLEDAIDFGYVLNITNQLVMEWYDLLEQYKDSA